jgi:tricorn protease-like protein
MITGAGANIWFGHDEFHFLWKKLSGDFIVRTNAAFIGKGVEAHRKFGWMVRSSLDSDAMQVNAVVHGDGLTSLQFRRTVGGNTEEKKSMLTGAQVVQLERKGNQYVMSVARAGDTFVTESIDSLALGDEVYVGLFVCSHNPAVSEQAVFNNVRIVVPAKAGFVPYHDYIGSDVELLDVVGGNSTILYQSPRSLQAPNWTKDGRSLIYNSEGLLYRLDTARGKTPVVINTGSATHNNNDHVLSFDGKQLGISNHTEADKNVSIVYVLPSNGGEPRRITKTGPSYLHGWSPDGKWLVFTGQRNGDFDIYKIPVNGGEEIRLTTAPGLDDGSEYSPDGKYIYFNSTRTGMMQVWRMKPDGSDQEQVTNDGFNNWFPHVSPDGKWIVYISFPASVRPDDHPFYKQVYLRLMPAAGGPSKVIAYLYGGQGTINTPSWSPDSKYIAFVSNTQLLFNTFPEGK